MKLFRSTAAALALTTGLLALPVHAQQNASGDPLYTSEAPAAFSMVADLLIARPLTQEAMLRGAGIDREEILRHADECEDELRNVDFEKSRDDLHASFDFHRDELRAISMELGKHL